jgi:hypothetical protein
MSLRLQTNSGAQTAKTTANNHNTHVFVTFACMDDVQYQAQERGKLGSISMSV